VVNWGLGHVTRRSGILNRLNSLEHSIFSKLPRVRNSFRQLGISQNDRYNIPTLAVNLPRGIVKVTTGTEYTLILTAEGKVYSFGSNSMGQLGACTNGNSAVALLIPSLPLANEIACGRFHSIIIGRDGAVYSFGRNYNGQLGIGSFERSNLVHLPRNVALLNGKSHRYVCGGTSHSMALMISGQMYGFGENGVCPDDF
jgi:alpha-tubulin suppressor-like RCC1 family protein